MHDGDSDSSQLDFFGVEGADFAHGFQLLVDDLHKDAVAFSMEDTHLFLAEEDGFVEEAMQHIQRLFGTMTSEVEGGVEVGTLLVHLVEDGSKCLIA